MDTVLPIQHMLETDMSVFASTAAGHHPGPHGSQCCASSEGRVVGWYVARLIVMQHTGHTDLQLCLPFCTLLPQIGRFLD